MSLETKLWEVPKDVDQFHDDIKEAARELRDKNVVAFPTETVYGLGADATNERAVGKIFSAKGRPVDNPLIVHVHSREQVGHLVTHIPDKANHFMDQCWPGPLTLILNSNGTAAENVTAGLSTVAIRMPAHPVALALLKAADLPVAAPSANYSGRPSPTAAEHVMQDLNGRISGVIDGGATGVGLESTVLDCTSDLPVILRPGGVPYEMLKQIDPDVIMDPALVKSAQEAPKSPGMKYTHYAPEAPLWLIDGEDDFFAEQIAQLERDNQRVGVIASRELAETLGDRPIAVCGSREHLAEIGETLYRVLRQFKKSDVDIIVCEAFPETGIGAAIMNRLKKAAAKKVNQF
ncbi:L-threonylcarbamoyladenylate synthase [Thalassobacillus sp. CUG 92003]|uniref:L-threonylcarbamoyladenylate synthase n=1 Tax=Thalassobacillus sp. CUG 92003 TaxID=2736641 RepID=UPI0015E6680C|nr:L-threonylcarbamoyladenylate synthase [Thalassobacillus sp. CUG 92003]